MRTAAHVTPMLVLLMLAGCDEEIPLQLQISVPFAPHLVQSPDWQHLAYEIDLSAYPFRGYSLRTIEVLDATTGTILGTYEDHSAKDQPLTKGFLLPAGNVTIPMFLVWLKLSPAASVPATLKHRFHFFSNNTMEMVLLEGATVTVDRSPVRVIAPPLRGERCFAAETSDGRIHHFHQPIQVGNATKMPQRHAVDLELMTLDYQMSSGDSSVNENWPGWGTDLYAVADGTVTDARDELVDHDGTTGPAVAGADATGNHVYLNIGQGQWAIYAHCMRGGVAVKTGEVIKKGQAVCKMGNSGNSLGAHLHFQISNGPDPMASESVPYVIDKFTVFGHLDDDGKFIEETPREVTERIPDYQSVLVFK
jgi:hypothetical protein